MQIGAALAPVASMAAVTPPQPLPAVDELDSLATGSLARRSEHAGPGVVEPGMAPGRSYYFQRADYDDLIAACTLKLEKNPSFTHGLMIRGKTYLKKGGCQCGGGARWRRGLRRRVGQ